MRWIWYWCALLVLLWCAAAWGQTDTPTATPTETPTQTPTQTPVCTRVYWSTDCSATGSYAWDSDCWTCTDGTHTAVAGLRPRRPDVSCTFDKNSAGTAQTVTVTGSAGMACREMMPTDDSTTWTGVLMLAPGSQTLTVGSFGSASHFQRFCADNLTVCHDDADCAGAPGTPCSNGFATDPTGTWTLRFTEITGLITQALTGDLHVRNVIFDPASAAWGLRGFRASGDLTVTGATLDNDANHAVGLSVSGTMACDGMVIGSSTGQVITIGTDTATTCAGATIDHVTMNNAGVRPLFAVSGSVDNGNNVDVCFNEACPPGTYTPTVTATPTATLTPVPVPNCYQIGDASPGSCNVGQPTPAPYCIDATTCSAILGPGCEAVVYSGGLCGGVPPSCTCQLVENAVCNPESLFGAPCVTMTPTPAATATATATAGGPRRHGFSGGAVINVR